MLTRLSIRTVKKSKSLLYFADHRNGIGSPDTVGLISTGSFSGIILRAGEHSGIYFFKENVDFLRKAMMTEQSAHNRPFFVRLLIDDVVPAMNKLRDYYNARG
jgi:hypothetical protein